MEVEMEITEVLKERGSVHGAISKNAEITDKIMECFEGVALSRTQRHCLYMVATKMSRIASGDPNHKDHWVDMAGYSTLAANSIKE
jgi:hypothetical protein